MNLPNKLTIARVVMIPIFLVFMLTPFADGAGKWIALALFIIASVTDFFDGKIARSRNLVTNFGKFMDPVADKMLVCSALICLTAMGRLSAWVTILIIMREFIISGLRTVAADNGVVIAASYWGKFKTASQMVMICMLIADFDNSLFKIATSAVVVIAVILTIVSLIDYLIKNKNVLAE